MIERRRLLGLAAAAVLAPALPSRAAADKGAAIEDPAGRLDPALRARLDWLVRAARARDGVELRIRVAPAPETPFAPRPLEGRILELRLGTAGGPRALVGSGVTPAARHEIERALAAAPRGIEAAETQVAAALAALHDADPGAGGALWPLWLPVVLVAGLAGLFWVAARRPLPCPNCGAPAVRARREILEPPGRRHPGRAVDHLVCRRCGHREEREVTLPPTTGLDRRRRGKGDGAG